MFYMVGVMLINEGKLLLDFVIFIFGMFFLILISFWSLMFSSVMVFFNLFFKGNLVVFVVLVWLFVEYDILMW